MGQNIILGGGHGTLALSLIPEQKVYFGTWDDGGSSGLVRSVYPDTLPFGDLRSVLCGKLIATEQSELAHLLSLRSANIRELLEVAKYLEKMTSVSLEGFSDFLENYYEAKLKYLLNNRNTEVPEDNFGNLLFTYFYQKDGVPSIKNWITAATKVDLKFDFIFTEPVFLYGYYFDDATHRLKILDSEALIGKWHKPVIQFTVKDAYAKSPQLNSQFIKDIDSSSCIFLAPGSPENYLPALDTVLTGYCNSKQKKVILIAQLFLSAKDQKLKEQMESLQKKFNDFEVWIPDRGSVQEILDDTNTLLSYAIQNKFLDVFFIPEYRALLNEYLKLWKEKAQENELYELLHTVYTEKSNGIISLSEWNIRTVVRVARERDGWKHDKSSLLKVFNEKKLPEKHRQ